MASGIQSTDIEELDWFVDAQNAVAQLGEESGPGTEPAKWVIGRKAFMEPLANAFTSRIDSSLLSAKGYELLQTLQSAAQRWYSQRFVADSEAARVRYPSYSVKTVAAYTVST